MKNALFLAAAVFLFGCKSQNKIVDPIEIAPTESFVDLAMLKTLPLSLVSVSIDNKVYLLEETTILLNLDLENLSYSGKSGCNSFFGSIDLIEESRLYVNVGGMTEMMCEAATMEWEKRFLNTLMETEFIVSEFNGTFIFTNEDATKVLNFNKIEK